MGFTVVPRDSSTPLRFAQNDDAIYEIASNYDHMIVTRQRSTGSTPVREAKTAGPGDKKSLAFNLFVWLAMSVAALALVATYGSNVPSWDDWDIVPTATGHQPVTLEWLWSQHNEHRVPVPRLLLLAMLRLLPMDFRTGMYFNALVASSLALGMMLAMRRLRGRSSYLDAFFPILLLNWSQAPNFLWCWQVQFYASLALAGTLIILMTRSGGPPKGATAAAAAVCVVLLPLCGANGLGLVPPLAVWLAYVGVVHWRSGAPGGRREALILVGAAIMALFLVGLYFAGYNSVPYHPSVHQRRVIAWSGLRFLTTGFGPGIVGLTFEEQPVPMTFWQGPCLAVGALFALTGGLLISVWCKQAPERARVSGLLLFLAAMSSLALGLGMGRDRFEIRYVTLSVPALCAIYFAWSLYGPTRLRSAVRVLLFATPVMLLVPNTSWGWRYADDLKSHLGAFEKDLLDGRPPYQLIHDYGGKYLHPHQLVPMDYMPYLREARVGVFRHLRNDPPFRELSLPLRPIESTDVTFESGTPRGRGMGASLTYELPAEMKVQGIRVRYACSSSLPYFAIYWKSRDQSEFRKERYTKYSPTGDRANWGRITWTRLQDDSSTVYAWACAPVQMIRILPMTRATIDIREVTLLMRAENENAPGRSASN